MMIMETLQAGNGGNYDLEGSAASANSRAAYKASRGQKYIGFRVAMYVEDGPTEAGRGITTLTLNKSSADVIMGNTLTLTASLNTTAAENITWTSSNKSVATVTGSGTYNTIATITAVSEGATVITAQNSSGTVMATCVVNVVEPAELPNTGETNPYLPTGFNYDGTTTLTTGLTIQDASLNQYVWVVVPKNTTVYDEIGIELDLDSMSEADLAAACGDIEEELQEYATDYRSADYADTWYDGCGIASPDDYNDLKNTMLKSVYQNGGFYIGKYETGTATARNASDDELTDAVIQANAYPYNFVTNAQAQGLASGMASGDHTSSLMFGVQWDLTLKYLQSKGATTEELKGTITGSTNWGNYSNSTYEITNGSAKYWVNSTDGWQDEPYGPKSSGTSVLLSTGADNQLSKMGIYDLAGNVYELTLEQYTSYTSLPCAYRGGYYSYNGGVYPASSRSSLSTSGSYRVGGFRVSLY